MQKKKKKKKNKEEKTIKQTRYRLAQEVPIRSSPAADVVQRKKVK